MREMTRTPRETVDPGRDTEPVTLPGELVQELNKERAPGQRKRPLVPQVPLVLDGEVVEDLERMNAETTVPLFMTRLVHDSSVALGAFTDREAMVSEARRLPAVSQSATLLESEHVCTSNPDSLEDIVRFWEDAGEQGDIRSVGPGLGYKDLSGLHRGFLGTQNWNNIISSLSWCRFDISLFDLTGFDAGGGEFFAPKGCNTPDLTPFGWNDRASSIANWGT
ncbi:hypothetical protein ACFCVY_11160 [Streptomyces sp. NPDC056411]|uniref:hypothetical protein n=1 Tax=Streptomyces sp. NPDC056411 TaxID=3345813 RepID=UPI0035DCAD01